MRGDDGDELGWRWRDFQLRLRLVVQLVPLIQMAPDFNTYKNQLSNGMDVYFAFLSRFSNVDRKTPYHQAA
jgi:hypothetical protein